PPREGRYAVVLTVAASARESGDGRVSTRNRKMFVLHSVLFATATLLALAGSALPPPTSGSVVAEPAETLPAVLPNDNRRSAGSFTTETLTLTLRAAVGSWRPEGDSGPALRIEAFGEVGEALRAPSPLIRVREGTRIVARVRNDLDASLRVFGLCAREGKPC